MNTKSAAKMLVTVGIVAGEASGDLLAARLISAVRARNPDVRFVGIAGPKMQQAGCEVLFPLEKLAVRGFVEVLAHLPELMRIRRQLARELMARRIPLFIGVDAPDFNLGLERRLKSRGVRTIHYVSPSVWAWRGKRVQSIGRSTDRVLALFPFEPAIYRNASIAVDFVGHPLAAQAATPVSRRQTRETLKLKPATPVFALLPGSRQSEIDMHAGVVLRAARLIHEARADAHFLVPLASRASREMFRQAMHDHGAEALPITLLYGHADDALQAADVALVASGTATLEAALARCPHVIFYKVAALTARIVARKLLLPYVGLTNVLAGRFVVPELLQDNATPENLARAAQNLFDDVVTRARLDALFAGFASALRADTDTRVADAVFQELSVAGVRC
ncbi:MAG: lipid-A-disaccharide synthase [Casimicrobiaceae bacterium]